MEVYTHKSIKKMLNFETSGETFSVEIVLENVSPNIEVETAISFLNKLFEETKKELTGQ